MSVQSDKIRLASEIQIGESEEDAKNRIKQLFTPEYDRKYRNMSKEDVQELERLHAEDIQLSKDQL